MSRVPGDVTSANTPTTPLSWTASTCCWSGSARDGFASAGPVDVAKRTAPRLHRTNRSRRRLPDTCTMIPVLFGCRRVQRPGSGPRVSCTPRNEWPTTIPPVMKGSAHPALPPTCGPLSSGAVLGVTPRRHRRTAERVGWGARQAECTPLGHRPVLVRQPSRRQLPHATPPASPMRNAKPARRSRAPAPPLRASQSRAPDVTSPETADARRWHVPCPAGSQRRSGSAVRDCPRRCAGVVAPRGPSCSSGRRHSIR